MTIEFAHHHIVLQAVILWSVTFIAVCALSLKVWIIHEDVRELKDRLDKREKDVRCDA